MIPYLLMDILEPNNAGKLRPQDILNLGNSLLMNAEKYPHKMAIVVDEESRTYEALNSRVNRLANALLGLGLKKGDHMGIMSMNSVPWVEALYAAFKSGGIVVPINYRLLQHEILGELHRNDVVFLFFTEEHLEVAKAYRDAKGEEIPLILLEGSPQGDILSLDALVAGSADREPSRAVKKEDRAVIMFTGGTTGLPKGAIFTHEMFAWVTMNYMIEYETPRTDHIMLHPFPLFHTSGMYRLISYIWAGATYLTMRNFDTERCLQLIERYGVTAFIGSSAVFMPMLEMKQERRFDTSSIKICCATFAFMDQEGRERLQALFPNAMILEGYGFTEGGSISALRPDQRPGESGSVGRPGANTKLKIVDEEGNELPRGEVGEIVVKGPHIPNSYYKNPDETRETFKEGWFYTGDMGRLDEEGFLYMVDRKKDMIKTGGENVYSREVEKALLRHPHVVEAAVIGVPHKRWGETIKAIVVKGKGAELTEEELIDFCRQHIASYKKPTSVDFVETIPKTETGGKISKRKLREEYGKALKNLK
jgi:acyl-CoA synthetase (AMP-forming)/AMP-acid ligase II